MTLLLLQYNNYFNRVIKVDTYDGYITHTHKLVSGVSFNPNDGVETEQIINWTESFNPDYCVVINENSEIVSRWFIKEAVRTRNGQYRLSLRRDLLADYNSEVLNAPCFVEKGYVSNNSPLIYNKEDFNANQLRKGEVLLTDETKCSWIVLYYDLKAKADGDLSGSISYGSPSNVINISAPTVQDWDVWQKYHSTPFIETRQKNFYIRAAYEYVSPLGLGLIAYNYRFNYTYDNVTNKLYHEEDFPSTDGMVEAGIYDLRSWKDMDTDSDYQMSHNKTFREYFQNNISGVESAIRDVWNENINEILQYMGTDENPVYVRTGNGKYYTVRLGTTTYGVKDTYTVSQEDELSDVYNAAANAINRYNFTEGNIADTFFMVRIGDVYQIIIEEVTPPQVATINFNFTSAKDVEDQPYGVLVLPYKNVDGNPIKFELTDEVANNFSIKIARELCKAGVGSDKVIYDAQILPYCPIEMEMLSGNRMNLGALDSSNYTIITDSGGNRLGFALHPNTTKFNKRLDILTPLVLKHIQLDDNVKVEHNLNFYRLVSPNWNGQAQFSGAMNGGIRYVNVECTYKPYSPYIHINPVWGGLYVGDNNTARGLICGGDFSLTVTGSAWENYKLQNKNFEAQFSRDIEHMDTSHTIDRAKTISNAAIGVVAGGIAGAAGSTPNPVKIGAGIAAGIGSGITNVVAGEKQYQENRDYTIDQHNYQLGNIQALPNSLNKVDAYNNNNKMFPFIEKYTCTDEEVEIFKNKLKYEGMTVNALGKISDYLNYSGEETFVKGQIIRLSDISEDSHLAYAIYEEVSKGVYL